MLDWTLSWGWVLPDFRSPRVGGHTPARPLPDTTRVRVDRAPGEFQEITCYSRQSPSPFLIVHVSLYLFIRFEKRKI